jgi:hypothetical protein
MEKNMTTIDIETPATDTTALAGLTYLALVANFTDTRLNMENLQNGNQESTPPKGLRRQYDFWVPWCQNEDDYTNKKRRIVIAAGDKNIFWIWENSNKLYYNRDNKFSSGKVIDGDNDNDGSYKAISMRQNANGDFEMAIVSVKHS